MLDEPSANSVSAVFPADKDWKVNLLDSNTLTAQLLEEFRDVSSQSSTDYGRTTLIEHQIVTGDARSIRQGPRRIPHAL